MPFIDAAEAPVYRLAATLSPGWTAWKPGWSPSARAPWTWTVRDRLTACWRLKRRVQAGDTIRLLSGLYGDASAIPDLDVQVVPVQEQHAHQGSAARRVGFDVPQLTVP